MSTEQLLDDLVAGLKPVKPRRARDDLLVVGIVATIELALFLFFGATRPDIMLTMKLPSFWWKLGSLGLLTVIGAVTAIQSFHPEASPRQGLRTMGYVVAVVLVLGWIVDAASAGGGRLWARLMWWHGIDCVFAIVVLSIPVIVAFGILMRRGASTDRSGSALAVGATSAAWGAFVFVFNCPHDDPLYIAFWYVVGSSIIVLAGRLLLPLVSRW